jgi:hypothetical protein
VINAVLMNDSTMVGSSSRFAYGSSVSCAGAVSAVHQPVSVLSAAVRKEATRSPKVGTSHRIPTTASTIAAGPCVRARTIPPALSVRAGMPDASLAAAISARP